MTVIDVRATLRPSGVDFDQIVSGMVRDVASAHGASVSIEGELWEVQPEARGVLLFVATEAATNAFTHGQAKHVAMCFDRGHAVMTVSDGGAGFNPMVRPPGHGLVRMRSLLESVGGSLTVESRRGHGTSVRAAFGWPGG